MGWNRKISLVLFLVAVATAGYFLRTLVPTMIEEYEKASQFDPIWGYVYLVVAGLGGAAFLTLAGWTIWTLASNTRGKSQRRASQSRTPKQMSRRDKEAEIDTHLADSRQLADDTTLTPAAREKIRRSLAEVESKLEQRRLEIVAFGTVSSGKSSLLNALAGRDVFRTEVRGGTTVTRNEVPWPGKDQVILVDTPGLAEIKGQDREELAKQAARDADLVLFVTDGPLKDFEMRLLEVLAAMEKPIVVCLNKEDWFRPADRDLLLGQIADQVRRLVPKENVVALRAQPGARLRTRVLADGTQSDETVEVEADIRPLADRMRAIVDREGPDLLVANLLLQSRGLAKEAKAQVQTELDARARQIVDRSMWQAGAAAALSPLPVIDLAAGLGITSHMVLQLVCVYRQKLDLDTASRLISELGKQLVSVAGANVAAPAAASGIASLLKTVPGVGTITGGLLQGLVQVLVMRWIGGVFIEYFRNEMNEAATDWASLARAQWSRVTQPEELSKLVKLDSPGWKEAIMNRDDPAGDEALRDEPLSADRAAEQRHHEAYHDAMAGVRHAIAQFAGLSDAEKAALTKELAELESISAKLEAGVVEIVLFGEIDTGKSALINALVGRAVAEVDVRGGWTREVWRTDWTGCGYVVPGFAESQVVLLDTPGINEVDGQARATIAHDAAARADLILFVTDSDLNHTEYMALAQLAASHKPLILVLNKVDNYTGEQRRQLREALADSRMRGIVAAEDVVETAADPLPREYVIEAPDGSTRSEMRQPPAQVEALKARILEVLERDGKALVALNAAMYAADRSDRIAALKVRMRDEQATTIIWSYAAMKSIGVALTPVPVADVLGGSAVDVTMVVTLAHIYGIALTWTNARQLIESILKAAGWVMLGEMATHLAASLFKGLTFGTGTVLTAIPQGAAAGYGSYIVGQAAKYYFEHGASWGGEAPKAVVSRILEATDKKSVLERLKAEINAKLKLNKYAR